MHTNGGDMWTVLELVPGKLGEDSYGRWEQKGPVTGQAGAYTLVRELRNGNPKGSYHMKRAEEAEILCSL